MDFTGLRYLTDLQLHGGRWADTHLAELIERLGDQLLNLGRILDEGSVSITDLFPASILITYSLLHLVPSHTTCFLIKIIIFTLLHCTLYKCDLVNV